MGSGTCPELVSGAFSRYSFFLSRNEGREKMLHGNTLPGSIGSSFRFLQTQPFLPFGGLGSLQRPRPDVLPVVLGYKGFLGGAGFVVFGFDMVYFF